MNSEKKIFSKPVVIAVSAVLLAVIVFVLVRVLGSKSVNVPEIVNMDIVQAQELLEKSELSICITRKEINDEVDENTVLEQSPKGGEKAEKGSVVNVTISEKSVEVSIPELKNYDKDLAVDILKNAGFKVEIEEVASDEFASGTVISQSQSGKGQTGSTITVTVSKNDKETSDKTVKVPSVVGKTVAQAIKLFDGKLYVSVVEEQFSDTVPKGVIIRQTPQADAKASLYTTVEVTVSKGKASDIEIVMPSVVYLTRSQAKATLENLGLKVKIENQFSDFVASGIVISQSIPKGKKIKADTTVTIYVSVGKQPEFTTVNPSTSAQKPTTTKKNESVTEKNTSQSAEKETKNTTVNSTTVKATELAGESKYTADFRIVPDKTEVKAGDIITVSVKLKTNYKIVAASVPIIYDSRVFELVGTDENNVSSFLDFKGTLSENAYSTNGNWKSPDSMYTKNSNQEYWTSDKAKNRYKIVFATWNALPSQGTVITSLDKEETILTFKLKVKSNVSDTSGRIFLSSDFIKTASSPQGILFVGRAKSSEINLDSIVTTGQTINVKEANALIIIK